MNHQQSSSATISSTRSNKRSRGGNTERKEYGIQSQNPSPIMSTDGNNNRSTSSNGESMKSEAAQTIVNTNHFDDAELSNSQNSTNKRPRSRSRSSSIDNQNQPNAVDNNISNEATTKTSTASNIRIEVSSQGTHFILNEWVFFED